MELTVLKRQSSLIEDTCQIYYQLKQRKTQSKRLQRDTKQKPANIIKYFYK